MITREAAERAKRCTAGDGCPEHPDMRGIHHPWLDVDVEHELRGAAILNEALERAIPDSWDGDDSWSHIASRWIEHMAATHGAHCAGPRCQATTEVPAYIGALRQMWRDTEQYGDHPLHPATRSYRYAVRDLAHELGVDLNG